MTVAAGCGSSGSATAPAPPSASRSTTTASSSPPSSAPSRPPSAPSAHRLENALLASTGSPRATSASCRAATAAERAAAPFGHTTLPVYVCLIAVEGHRDAFDVQVLTNGCYVAERRTPGQAIYGCGAGRAS